MSNKKKVINLRKETKPMMSDEAKIKAYNLKHLLGIKSKALPIDTEVSWLEYLCEVQYTFTNYKPKQVRTMHHIVTGNTELDVDAHLEHLIQEDLAWFEDRVPDCVVKYEVVSIDRLVLKK